jgi:uncharacterized membrane protein YhhN
MNKNEDQKSSFVKLEFFLTKQFLNKLLNLLCCTWAGKLETLLAQHQIRLAYEWGLVIFWPCHIIYCGIQQEILKQRWQGALSVALQN